MEPGFASTCPRSTSSFFVPRRRAPMLSPARPSSSSLRNISTPVQVVLVVGRRPMISISSPTFTIPRPHPPLDPPRHPGATTGDREDVLDGHQERLVDRTLGLGDERVDRVHQLGD